MTNQLCVGNLGEQTSRTDLAQLFAPFGRVELAEVCVDSATRRSRGFGFVKMSNDAEAQTAQKALDGSQYDGRVLKVLIVQSGPEPGAFGDRSGCQPCEGINNAEGQ